MTAGDAHLANLLGALSTAVQDAVGTAMTEESHLDATATAALLVICTRPAQSVGALAASLEITHSAAVRVADRLQKAGLARRGDGADGRTVGLYPSAEAEARMQGVLAARRRVLASILTPLSSAEREQFESALYRILHALPQSRLEAWRVCRLCEHGVCVGDACPVGTGVAAGEK